MKTGMETAAGMAADMKAGTMAGRIPGGNAAGTGLMPLCFTGFGRNMSARAA